MKITSIEINNYRSISCLELPVQSIGGKNCNIFLGMNETGKSNLLNGISLLNPHTPFEYADDCNKSAKKSNSSITIEYTLAFQNFNFYKKQFSDWSIDKTLHDLIDITSIIRYVEIDHTNERSDYINVWIKDGLIDYSLYVRDKEDGIISLITSVYDGDEKVTTDNVEEIFESEFEILTKLGLEEHLEGVMFSSIDANIPKCIFWNPSENFLINKPVDLNDFSGNNGLSIPLANIFRIAGVNDIPARIEQIRDDYEERVQLREELTDAITNYINKAWPEHQINVRVEIENMQCTVMVEDKDATKAKYRMEQRSDGFKQFVSILLNLSIENNTDIIKNKVVLLDEPEIHLHPSGVRYLRDELLNISENNIVFISSHSIYMVDTLNLGRHYKVIKEKGVTSIKQINANNPYEEEVIYEALGTSVYEHIQPNMIVFEGKTDKDLFDAYTKKFKTDLKPVNIGSISADGVEKVPLYTKFMDGRFVKGFVQVDSDKDGKRIKTQVVSDNANFNTKNTFEINDILNTSMEATLEDLYPKELIVEVVKDQYEVDIELADTPVIKQLERKTKSLGGKINIKELKGILVQKIIIDLTNKKNTKQIIKDKYPTYHKFIEKLHTKLKR